MPPLLTSLFLVFVAARTGWFPIAGMRSAGAPAGGALARSPAPPRAAGGCARPAARRDVRAAAVAGDDAKSIGEPFVLATLARGVPRSRVVWRDALKAALRPIAAVYGLIVGTLLSGSFAVEVISAWPGLGTLMLGALRDARRLPRGRLRRRRRAVPRVRHALLGRGAGVRRSARERHVARKAIRGVTRRLGLAHRVAGAGGGGRGAAARAARGQRSLRRPAQRAADASRASSTIGGSLHAPFIYPWRRVSQLEQRYEEDRSARVAARRGSAGGRLVQSANEPEAPLLLLGADSFGRDVFSRLRLRRAPLARPRGRRRARRAAPRRVVRRRRRLLRRRARRPADADDRLRDGAAGDVRRAGAAVGAAAGAVGDARSSCCSPASSPSSARRSSRAACAPSCAPSGGSTTPPPRRRSAPSDLRLLARHLLPATRGFLAVQITLLVPAFIVAEATLSYVGPRVSRSGGELGDDAARRVDEHPRRSPIFRGCSARRRRCSSSCSG